MRKRGTHFGGSDVPFGLVTGMVKWPQTSEHTQWAASASSCHDEDCLHLAEAVLSYDKGPPGWRGKRRRRRRRRRKGIFRWVLLSGQLVRKGVENCFLKLTWCFFGLSVSVFSLVWKNKWIYPFLFPGDACFSSDVDSTNSTLHYI